MFVVIVWSLYAEGVSSIILRGGCVTGLKVRKRRISALTRIEPRTSHCSARSLYWLNYLSSSRLLISVMDRVNDRQAPHYTLRPQNAHQQPKWFQHGIYRSSRKSGLHIYWIIPEPDSSVATATGYTAVVRFPAGARNFSLLHNVQTRSGYRGLFPRGQSGQGVKLTTRLHLVPRSRMMELYLDSSIRLHEAMLNYFTN